MQIPPEYEIFDYGFSGVDAPGEVVQQSSTPTIIHNPEIDEKLENIHEDIRKILFNQLKDNTSTTTNVNEKIRQLEAIIIPLLNNLLKTADKDYIFWPNRKETIKRQIANVLAITRG